MFGRWQHRAMALYATTVPKVATWADGWEGGGRGGGAYSWSVVMDLMLFIIVMK